MADSQKTFPYISDDTGVHPLSPHAIWLGVTSANAGTPVVMVSTINSITTTAISANQSLSAVLLAGTANIGYVSAYVDNGSVSAKSGDANQFHVSGFSPDASLFRVSAIGGASRDGTIVDGTTQTISATLTPISASPAGTVQGLVTNTFQYDANKFHASAFVDSGSISAKNQDANFMHVSGFSPDSGLFRVSGILAAGVSSSGATNFPVSAAALDAGTLRTSTILAAGISGSGAQNLVVSAVVGDAGTARISALNQDANFMHVSGFSPDAGLFRVSATNKAVTDTELTMFSTSAGIAQLSVVKSTGNANLYGYQLFNPAGVQQYLQVFNASATSAVTLGTTVASKIIGIPATGGGNVALTIPDTFTQGIVVAVTSTAGGNTAGASAMVVNIDYL
jgi:hypothetical protein